MFINKEIVLSSCWSSFYFDFSSYLSFLYSNIDLFYLFILDHKQAIQLALTACNIYLIVFRGIEGKKALIDSNFWFDCLVVGLNDLFSRIKLSVNCF